MDGCKKLISFIQPLINYRKTGYQVISVKLNKK